LNFKYFDKDESDFQIPYKHVPFDYKTFLYSSLLIPNFKEQETGFRFVQRNMLLTFFLINNLLKLKVIDKKNVKSSFS